MALTIVAGLAVATVLILLVVPALIAVQDDFGTLRRVLSGQHEGSTHGGAVAAGE